MRAWVSSVLATVGMALVPAHAMAQSAPYPYPYPYPPATTTPPQPSGAPPAQPAYPAPGQSVPGQSVPGQSVPGQPGATQPPVAALGAPAPSAPPDIPAPYEDHPTWSLVVTGLSLTGAGWLTSVFVAGGLLYGNDPFAGSCAPLFIPVLGPWITMASHGAQPPSFYYDPRNGGTGFALILDGVVQTTGAALFTAGMLVRQRRWREQVASHNIDPMPTFDVGPGHARATWRW
jgi:hypothetical protein